MVHSTSALEPTFLIIFQVEPRSYKKLKSLHIRIYLSRISTQLSRNNGTMHT